MPISGNAISVKEMERKEIEMIPEQSGKGLLKTVLRVLEKCHNMKVFIVIYAGGLLFYGMSVSYTNSMLISIERRFGLNTKQMGSILAATEIGHIITALLVAHFAGSSHRPRWICLGTILMGLALLLFAGPEIFFRSDAPPIQRYGNGTSPPQESAAGLCHPGIFGVNPNSSAACHPEQGRMAPIIVLSFAHVLLGFGSTTPLVLGMPYVDDNVPPIDVPIYFGIALFGRLVGPLIGFGLGAGCNLLYYDLSKPNFPPSDTKWISAWYIGFIVTGTGLLLFGLLIGCFPSRMPATVHRQQNQSTTVVPTLPSKSALPVPENEPKTGSVLHHKSSVISVSAWKDFVINLKRLFLNLAFVCRTSAMFVDAMIIAGIFNFFPKYFAQQFRMSQFQAALSGGLYLVISVIVGIILGSFIIKTLKLQPRHVGLLLVISSLILTVGFFIAMGLGCDKTEIYGLPQFEESHGKDFAHFFCPSSSRCGCAKENFSPVCDLESHTNYYSPCHAGCKQVLSVNATKYYHDCSCANLPLNNGSFPHGPAHAPGELQFGLCPQISCRPFYLGLTALMIIVVFFEGLPMSGQVMVQFRVVDVDLKNLCAGVTSVMVAGLGLLPAPIFIGAIVDSACRLWQAKSCGETGACLLYDTDQFRWKFFLTGACLKLITGILDSVVTWKVWAWQFERDDEKPKPETPLQVMMPAERNNARRVDFT